MELLESYDELRKVLIGYLESYDELRESPTKVLRIL